MPSDDYQSKPPGRRRDDLSSSFLEKLQGPRPDQPYDLVEGGGLMRDLTTGEMLFQEEDSPSYYCELIESYQYVIHRLQASERALTTGVLCDLLAVHIHDSCQFLQVSDAPGLLDYLHQVTCVWDYYIRCVPRGMHPSDAAPQLYLNGLDAFVRSLLPNPGSAPHDYAYDREEADPTFLAAHVKDLLNLIHRVRVHESKLVDFQAVSTILAPDLEALPAAVAALRALQVAHGGALPHRRLLSIEPSSEQIANSRSATWWFPADTSVFTRYFKKAPK